MNRQAQMDAQRKALQEKKASQPVVEIQSTLDGSARPVVTATQSSTITESVAPQSAIKPETPEIVGDETKDTTEVEEKVTIQDKPKENVVTNTDEVKANLNISEIDKDKEAAEDTDFDSIHTN